MCLLGFSTFLGQNSVMPQLGGGGAMGLKTQNLPFFFHQLIRNQKLYNISKNQSPKSIRRGDEGIFLLFNLKIVLFLPYLLSKFG